jgi:DNA mismatch repair protein MutS2
MEVILKSNRRRGVLQRRAKKNQWVVATDSIKVTLPESELEPLPGGASAGGQAEPSHRGTSVQFESAGEGPRATHELDLRGKTLAEAIDLLDSQIDAALMTGLYRFGIIHGKGTGVLQRGIREHLEQSAVVDSFHYAPPEEGGYGKTVVEITRD